MRSSAPSSSKWPARIARPWRCLTGLGEPPGTELSRQWRPRRDACCAPTQPRSRLCGATGCRRRPDGGSGEPHHGSASSERRHGRGGPKHGSIVCGDGVGTAAASAHGDNEPGNAGRRPPLASGQQRPRAASADRCHESGDSRRRRFAAGCAEPEPRRAHRRSAGGRCSPARVREFGGAASRTQ